MEVDLTSKSVQNQYGEFVGPENIMFHITQKCNFKCLHCYNESADNYCMDLDDVEMLKVVNQI